MNNPPSIDKAGHHYAGVFLITDSGKVVGQQRDNKPNIDNPNRVGSFGGTVEAGEDPRAAAWRELVQEETNLTSSQVEIKPYYEDVAWRELTKEWEGRHFYYVYIADSDLASMEVYEGHGWAYINSPEDELLIELWRDPVKALFAGILNK